MATENTQPGQQAAMEDILSSIRTTMAEETAKVGSGSADLIDAAAEQDGPEDDVLELSAADMVTAPTTNDIDELIDIAAFASTGEAKTVNVKTAAQMADDILGESSSTAPVVAEAPAVASPSSEAADDFDRLLAEISQEQQQNVAASEVSKQALMDEEEPLGAEEVDDEPPTAEELIQDIEDTAMAEAVAAVSSPAGTSGGASFTLGAIDTPQGVQVAFPAEVLALALRPMVQDWLAKNLPGVVEKLVKEEISKLTQN